MLIKTPICDFGQAAKSFELKSTKNETIKLNDIRGNNGTLIMFICNHCPYVRAIIKDIVEDCRNLEQLGINAVAICANDSVKYPEDSFDRMIEFSNSHNFYFRSKLLRFYCNIIRMQMQAPKTQEPITIIKVAFSIASITFFMLPALSL